MAGTLACSASKLVAPRQPSRDLSGASGLKMESRLPESFYRWVTAGQRSRERGFALLDGVLDGARYQRDHDIWLGDLQRVADQSMHWPDRVPGLRDLSAALPLSSGSTPCVCNANRSPRRLSTLCDTRRTFECVHLDPLRHCRRLFFLRHRRRVAQPATAAPSPALHSTGGVFSICTTAWLTYATPSFAESKHLSLMLAGVTTPF
ncbi:hypothetical protein GGR60_000695 [Xanthomonas arboricola]|nr:hypothetical protein [Xanthomonas euroxanthea]NJC36205.1 hypothetical protein [Xanthomonas euroxanthea]